MAEWHCTIDGEQTGPLELPQLQALLQSGRLKGEDLVWREGWPEWVPAGTAQELNGTGVSPPKLQIAYAAPEMTPPLPMVGIDEGPFFKVGNGFSVKGARWSGPAVASPRAIYLLKLTRIVYQGGGLIGYVIARALARDDKIRTCALDELPHLVRVQLDKKGKRGAKDVIVLPKEFIGRMKFGSINNQMKVFVADDKFVLSTGLFKRRLKTFLLDNGWNLNELCR